MPAERGEVGGQAGQPHSSRVNQAVRDHVKGPTCTPEQQLYRLRVKHLADIL